MSIEELKTRFKNFAIAVARLIQKLPDNVVNRAYCNQLIRSSSSSAANYRSACRAKSQADFIHKLKIVEEELDESVFFLELLATFNEKHRIEIEQNMSEGRELLAIIIKSIKTAKAKQKA